MESVKFKYNGKTVEVTKRGLVLDGKEYANILSVKTNRWVLVVKPFKTQYLGLEVVDGEYRLTAINSNNGAILCHVEPESCDGDNISSQLADIESQGESISNTSVTIYNRKHDYFAAIVKTQHTRKVLNIAIQTTTGKLKYYEDGKASSATYLQLEDASTQKSPNLRAKAVGNGLTFLLFRSAESTTYFVVCIEEDIKAAESCANLEANLCKPMQNHNCSNTYDQSGDNGRPDMGDAAEAEALAYSHALNDA